MRAIHRKLVRDLFALKAQVLTIALVVVAGVSCVVGLMGAYGALVTAQQSFYAQARFADVFLQFRRAPLELIDRVSSIDGIAAVEARIVKDVLLDLPDLSEPAVGRLISLGQKLNQVVLRHGAMPDPRQPEEVLISEGFARAHGFTPGARFKGILNGRLRELRVSGIALSPEYVYALRSDQPLPDDLRFGAIWASREFLADVFGFSDGFNDLSVELSKGAPAGQVIAGLDRFFAPYGGTGAYSRDQQPSHRALRDEISQQRILATTVPVIFLAVASFLVHLVMMRLIGTQRQQIAALKAIGYGNLSVGLHYLGMVLVIVFLGSIGGVMLGTWFGNLLTGSYERFFHFPVLRFRPDPVHALFGAGASFLFACSGALIAVLRVVRLPPAEAMRPPAPTSYRRTVLDRARFLIRLPVRERMMIRVFVTKPVRTLLTTVGIGAGVAIVIAGLFWGDVIDEILRVQFQQLQREDALVSFVDPMDASVVHEIAGIPGVQKTEGIRVVPVRLRAGTIHRLTAIFGIPDASQLRPVLKETLLSEGIQLSLGLAKQLGIGPGHPVQVEVLEGIRPVRQARVSGIVEERVGAFAFMERGALNRLLREGDLVSSVAITVEPDSEKAVYRKLKERPKVASVNLRKEFSRTFRKIMAGILLLFATILSLFASFIAVGVVYNSARIALSERSWELAALRVLGFTRAEVFRLIISEIALEVLLAIPLGIVMGRMLAATLVTLFHTETFQIPFLIEPKTYAFGALVVLAAAIMSAALVRRNVYRIDLMSALRARE